MKKGEWMWKEVFMIQTINRRKQPLSTSKGGRFCLGVTKVEIQDGTIIGKLCPMFDYTEKKIITIDAYKK